MHTRRTHPNSLGNQQAGFTGRRKLMAALLSALAWCSTDAALGEDESASLDSSLGVSPVGSAHGQPLDAARLDGIRGRFVPVSALEVDEPLGVILWDEGRGSHSGSRTGTSQSTQQGSNQQQQSLRTTSVR